MQVNWKATNVMRMGANTQPRYLHVYVVLPNGLVKAVKIAHNVSSPLLSITYSYRSEDIHSKRPNGISDVFLSPAAQSAGCLLLADEFAREGNPDGYDRYLEVCRKLPLLSRAKRDDFHRTKLKAYLPESVQELIDRYQEPEIEMPEPVAKVRRARAAKKSGGFDDLPESL
jgi:hypothetical protein